MTLLLRFHLLWMSLLCFFVRLRLELLVLKLIYCRKPTLKMNYLSHLSPWFWCYSQQPILFLILRLNCLFLVMLILVIDLGLFLLLILVNIRTFPFRIGIIIFKYLCKFLCFVLPNLLVQFSFLKLFSLVATLFRN